MIAAVNGFLLSLSLILAIGAQNAFVLRQGLRREHVAAVVAACAISDAILIALGVAGFGALAEALPGIAPTMKWVGALFLIAYGAFAFHRAWRGGAALDPGGPEQRALGPVLATCLALTWLNPHVYLDTVVLLGSIASQYTGRKLEFALGAVTASFVFFTTLGYGARLLTPVFKRPQAWRILEGVIGCVMWAIALKLILL